MKKHILTVICLSLFILLCTSKLAMAFADYKRTIRGLFDFGGTGAGITGIYSDNGTSLGVPNSSDEALKLQEICKRNEECEVVFSIDETYKVILHSIKHISINENEKAFDPNNDPEGVLLVLKQYRDILNEKYGILLQDNNSIIVDSSGNDIKGKIFLEAIQENGYSLDKTFNKILDKYKDNFENKEKYRNNAEIISHLVRSSRIFLVNQAREGKLYKGFNESTLKKLHFVSTKWYQTIMLDEAIINGNKEKINNQIISLYNYGFETDAKLRVIILQYTGKHDYKKDKSLAIKSAKKILDIDQKRDIISYEDSNVLKTLIILDKLYNSSKKIDFKNVSLNKFYEKIGITYLATQKVDYSLYNPIAGFNSGMFYLDPFSEYVVNMIKLEMNDHINQSDFAKKYLLITSQAQKEIVSGWLRKFALKMIKPDKKFSREHYGAAAFYCLAPSDEEGIAIVKGTTEMQKQYKQYWKNFLELLKANEITYNVEYKSRFDYNKDSYGKFKVKMKMYNNATAPIEGMIFANKNLKLTGTVNYRPFSFSAIRLTFYNTTNFLSHSKVIFLTPDFKGGFHGFNGKYQFKFTPNSDISIPIDTLINNQLNQQHNPHKTIPTVESIKVSNDTTVKATDNKFPESTIDNTAKDDTKKANTTSGKTTLTANSSNPPVKKEQDSTKIQPPLQAVHPTAPASKNPGIAVIIPTTTDTMSLTAFTPDKKPDSCIQVVALNPSPLTAVRIETMGGASASWKTMDVKTKAQGVLAIYQGDKIINANDASFSIDVSKETPLNLCVQDDGILNDKKNRMRVIFYHKDNTRRYAILER